MRFQFLILAYPQTVTKMIAGKLFVGDVCVFGQDSQLTDWAQALSTSSGDWDGHCWVVIGDYIVDVSIFRTAYSTRSPPVLAHAVREAFGTGRGLMIAQDTHPLRYQPEYVLTDAQIDTSRRVRAACLRPSSQHAEIHPHRHIPQSLLYSS